MQAYCGGRSEWSPLRAGQSQAFRWAAPACETFPPEAVLAAALACKRYDTGRS